MSTIRLVLACIGPGSRSWQLLLSTVQNQRTRTSLQCQFRSICLIPIDLALHRLQKAFTLTGNGFANLGFALPAVNFNLNGVRLASVRATSMTGAKVALSIPTTSGLWGAQPGLSAGIVSTTFIIRQDREQVTGGSSVLLCSPSTIRGSLKCQFPSRPIPSI